MSYQATISKRGQVVIPKDLRQSLGLTEHQTIIFVLSDDGEAITIRPAPDILDLAGSITPKQPPDALHARTATSRI
jgi:looped-hinge helix DNA binding domain, AbrB family